MGSSSGYTPSVVEDTEAKKDVNNSPYYLQDVPGGFLGSGQVMRSPRTLANLKQSETEGGPTEYEYTTEMPQAPLPSQGPAYNEQYKGVGGPDLVARAYQSILGRAPDPAGYEYWTNKMQQEGMTGQGLLSQFTRSPEFQRAREYERAYTEAFRPGYQEFGPSGQYFQPIYQSSYSQYMQPPGLYRPSYEAPNPFAYRSAEAAPPVVDQGIAALGPK